MGHLYPLFLDMRNRVAVVVGGGRVAARKVEALLDAGAIVRVVSPRYEDEIVEWSKDNSALVLKQALFEASDLDGASLVIAATDDPIANRAISTLATDRGIWVNVVDDPLRCTFFMPSLITRGDLTIAVSTGGRCPALARKVRETLDIQFDQVFGALLEHLSAARAELFKRYPADPTKRSEIMNAIVDSGIIEKAHRLSGDDLRKEIQRWL